MTGPGYAVVKDRCEDCGRVLYGWMPLDTPLPPPRCGPCRRVRGAALAVALACVLRRGGPRWPLAVLART